MPRRGSFGRLPRAGSDLTATIISIARAMQDARDSNVMDAWKNGGLFEGSPVTDDMVMDYWRARLSEIDPDDPLYDQYSNNVTHLEYNIAQSKAELTYRQSAPSAGADRRMAQFYLDWSKKVPKDSEFYRELQKDAAQFVQSAKARGRAGAGQAAEEAYGKERDAILKKGDAGVILTQVMTQWARDNNIIGVDEDLNKFRLAGENDPGRMEALLDQVNADIAARPAEWKALLDQLEAADPTGFDGQITSSYFAGALKDQSGANTTAAALAAKTGHKGETKTFTTAAENISLMAQGVGAWSPAETYQQAFDARQTVFDDPTSSDEERRQAGLKFAELVEKIVDDPALSTAIANRMLNDVKASRGDVSAGQIDSTYTNFLGLKDTAAGTDAGATGDGSKPKGVNADIAAQMERYQGNYENITAYPDQFIWGIVNDAGGFDPTGKRVGVVSATEVVNSPARPQIVVIPQTTGGALPVAAGTQPVYAKDASGERQIGSMLSYNVGGLTVRLYEVMIGGELVKTADPPFNPGAVVTYDSKGAHVDVTGLPGSYAAEDYVGTSREQAVVPATATSAAYQDVVKITYNTKGEQVSTITRNYGEVNPKTGKFVTTGDTDTLAPTVAPVVDLTTVALDTARMIAGVNTNTDLTTWALASISILPPSVAFDASQAMIRNPQFMAALAGQEWQAAGLTTGDANDPNLPAYNMLRMRNWAALTSVDNVFNTNIKLTNPAMSGAERSRLYGNPFTPGTLRGSKAAKSGLTIVTPTTLTLPKSPLGGTQGQAFGGRTPEPIPAPVAIGPSPSPSPAPAPIAKPVSVAPAPAAVPLALAPTPAAGPAPLALAPVPAAVPKPAYHDQYDPISGRLRIGGA